MIRVSARFLFACSLLMLNAHLPVQAQSKLQVKHRLQAGAERDNNIFETPESEVATLAGRFLYSNQLQKRWRHSALTIQYAGGLQIYPEFSEENKTVQDLSGSLRWQLSKHLSVVGQLRGNAKAYFDAPLDFAHSFSSLTLNALLTEKTVLSLLVSSSRLDYAEFDAFDYANRQLGARLTRALPGAMTIEGALYFNRFNYLRKAYRLDRLAFNPVLEPLPFDQQDDQWHVQVRLRFGRKYILHFTGEYMHTDANSFGYSNEQARLSAIFGRKFGHDWLLRLAAMMQFKDYRENIVPVIQRTLDPESDENNFIVADLSYNYTTRLTYLIRLAAYKNESALRGSFYRKLQLFIGAEYRF